MENYDNQLPRNSKDLKVDARGKELLEICKLNDLLILNGRIVGDIFGNLTSHQWNGSSVVDYAMTPNNFSKTNQNFSVGKFIPWISDHCPIFTALQGDWASKPLNKLQTKDLQNIPVGHAWNEASRDRYFAGLKSNSNLLMALNTYNGCLVNQEVADAHNLEYSNPSTVL